MTDEKLIEEAAKAIHKVAMQEYPGMDEWRFGWKQQKDRDRDVYLREAEAALEVFEKAHAPTERKPLWSTECGWDGEHDKCQRRACGCSCHAPTDDERPALSNMTDIIRRAITEWGEEFDDSDLTIRIRTDLIAAGFRRSEVPEPQGEPTDAQVEAALSAWRSEWNTDDVEAMRAALRAAGEVKR